MAELEHIIIERIERDKYRWYHLSAAAQDWRSPIGMHLSPDELLELAAYVEENRAQLEQEQEEDDVRNARAIEADAKDFNQIKREWYQYAHEGDETPPTPPSKLI